MFNQVPLHTTSGGRDQPEQDEFAAPGVSEVTLVEVTLLGDLVRILDETKTQQRVCAEEEKLANAHRAALLEAQRETARHQAALVQQQRIANAVAIRRCVCFSGRWYELLMKTSTASCACTTASRRIGCLCLC